ncbi:hypothetical protein PanWU01x14_209700 [Parasponia andersonii]|uniref:Uncharacterized protein n=1 Tax=Parasponia andersonii TaxID=3476 RepID=A0A2P5BUC5_PARAD|nr:hypothetical protein PanWU01x14_209700 [Parasponia andersonii]
MDPKHCPESEPMLDSLSSNNPNIILNRLDEPISLKKSVRSCTQHLISKFVSYEGLSPIFCAFTTNLSNFGVPRTIKEALAIPEWKVIVLDEMQGLKRIVRGI